jgi:hypothetical protein
MFKVLVINQLINYENSRFNFSNNDHDFEPLPRAINACTTAATGDTAAATGTTNAITTANGAIRHNFICGAHFFCERFEIPLARAVQTNGLAEQPGTS